MTPLRTPSATLVSPEPAAAGRPEPRPNRALFGFLVGMLMESRPEADGDSRSAHAARRGDQRCAAPDREHEHDAGAEGAVAGSIAAAAQAPHPAAVEAQHASTPHSSHDNQAAGAAVEAVAAGPPSCPAAPDATPHVVSEQARRQLAGSAAEGAAAVTSGDPAATTAAAVVAQAAGTPPDGATTASAMPDVAGSAAEVAQASPLPPQLAPSDGQYHHATTSGPGHDATASMTAAESGGNATAGLARSGDGPPEPGVSASSGSTGDTAAVGTGEPIPTGDADGSKSPEHGGRDASQSGGSSDDHASGGHQQSGAGLELTIGPGRSAPALASSAAPTGTGTPPAQHPAVTQTLGRIQAALAAGQASVHVRLEPASLGPVDVRIVARSGAIEVRLTAANRSTRDALEGGIAHLHDRLAGSGYAVRDIRVEMPAGASGGLASGLGNPSGHQLPQGRADTGSGGGWRQSFRLNDPHPASGGSPDARQGESRPVVPRGSGIDYRA